MSNRIDKLKLNYWLNIRKTTVVIRNDGCYRNYICHSDVHVPAWDLLADLSLFVLEQVLVPVNVLTTCHLQNKDIQLTGDKVDA